MFFDGARTAKENVLGPVGEGWKVAMATLGFERGTAFLSQQLAFEHEFSRAARRRAQARRRRATRCSATSWPNRYIGLQVMRFNGMRMLTNMLQQGALGPEASIGKLFWTSWHRRFGETAMDVIGADALLVDQAGAGTYELDELHRDLHGEPRGDDLRRFERDPTQHHR